MIEFNMPLELVTLLDKSDDILHPSMPTVSRPKQFMGEGFSSNMAATSSFVDFDKY